MDDPAEGFAQLQRNVFQRKAAWARSSSSARQPVALSTIDVVQPGQGHLGGDLYLSSLPDQVLWGYVPTVHASPVLQMRSGQTVTIDSVSHEGMLEDQGRNPVEYFGGHGVAQAEVLDDVKVIAAEYKRTPRNFAKDGPHVVTGPIFVEGAEPGDVLKSETLEAIPRVPYGVVSSRHGKGALALMSDNTTPAGISLEEVMPPVFTDGRNRPDPTTWGNVSVFTRFENGRGVMPFGRNGAVRFPLSPFMGIMGVAFAQDHELTSANAASRYRACPWMIRHSRSSSMRASKSGAASIPTRARRVRAEPTSSCHDNVHGQRSVSASMAALSAASCVTRLLPSGSPYCWLESSSRVSPVRGGNDAAKCIRRQRFLSNVRLIWGARSACTSSVWRKCRLTTKSRCCSRSI
jgi:acetamidase/formamidase